MKKLVLILAICAGSARADDDVGMTYYFSGNVLYEWCQGQSEWQQNNCLNYIIGVNDGIAFTNSVACQIEECVEFISRICVPRNTARVQLRDVVMKRLEEDPENRHLTAAAFVLLALLGAFPCD